MAASAGSATAETNGNGASNPTLNFTSTNFVGYFNWESTAEVNVSGVAVARAVTGTLIDADATVTAAFKAGWILKILVFSFAGSRPSEVAWDPTVGASIDYEAINGSGSSLSPSIALVAILAFWLLKRE